MIRAHRRSWLYLFNINPDCEVFLLHSPGRMRSRPLDAGRPVAIPPAELGPIMVAGPYGREIVFAVATAEPADLPPELAFATTTRRAAGPAALAGGRERGFLVPTDAPNPLRDAPGFRRKALSMAQIVTWAREMTAKHALFLFDSCFSGTVFRTRALPDEPPHIDRLANEPVRQFITAGSANEEVPARSVFTPAFVDALEHREGDLVEGTSPGCRCSRHRPET